MTTVAKMKTSSINCLTLKYKSECITTKKHINTNTTKSKTKQKPKKHTRKRRLPKSTTTGHQSTLISATISSPPHKKHKSTANTKNNQKNQKKIVFKLFGEEVHRQTVTTNTCARVNKRTIGSFEAPINYRSVRHSPYICCYCFANDWKVCIDTPLGRRKEIKEAIRILGQDLVAPRAKGILHTDKPVFLCWIRAANGKMAATAILLRDTDNARLKIEMFAVDRDYRGRGLADILVYTIQTRMEHCPSVGLFTAAIVSAVPFWSKPRYNFERANTKLLHHHEVVDEKKGNTKHLVWKGSPTYAKFQLLNRFLIYEHNLNRN